MIHAGQLIERTLHEQGRTVTWFATQLYCTRPNVYKLFRQENMDIHLLWRISCILGHDFFRDLSDSINTGNAPGVSKSDTVSYRSWNYTFPRWYTPFTYLCRHINI